MTYYNQRDNFGHYLGNLIVNPDGQVLVVSYREKDYRGFHALPGCTAPIDTDPEEKQHLARFEALEKLATTDESVLLMRFLVSDKSSNLLCYVSQTRGRIEPIQDEMRPGKRTETCLRQVRWMTIRDASLLLSCHHVRMINRAWQKAQEMPLC